MGNPYPQVRIQSNDEGVKPFHTSAVCTFVVEQVTWLKDNHTVPINRNGRFILSNENSLIIASVEKSDAGNYTCSASNLAGSVSSEPAELIVHGNERARRRRRRDRSALNHSDDRGWSDWQEYSECKGVLCSQGRQRRQRTCLNPPTITNRPSCDGEQFQERECSMPCPKVEHQEPFPNWTPIGSARPCLEEPCFDQLTVGESRTCADGLCSPIDPMKIIYSSLAVGSVLLILLVMILWLIRSFRQRRKKSKRND